MDVPAQNIPDLRNDSNPEQNTAQENVAASIPPVEPVQASTPQPQVNAASTPPVSSPAPSSHTVVPEDPSEFLVPQEAPVAAPPVDAPAQNPDENTPPDSKIPVSAEGVVGILLKNGALNENQYNQARAESITTGEAIEQVLLDHGFVNEEELTKARAEHFNVEFVKLSEIGVAPEALNQIPEGVAQRYNMLPFSIDKANMTLSVGMVNPLDLRAIDFVEKKSGYRIIPHFVMQSDLDLAIQERYAQSLSSEVTAALKETDQGQKKVVDVTQLGEVIREAPIAKIVETLLTFAMKSRASDVHIEPQEDKTRVRYRIDGILHEKLVLPKGVHDAVISRIKILADLKIDEKRMPQDGRFSFSMGDEEVDLRVSTLPTVNGEKVVMRLLKKNQQALTLGDLGLRGAALRNVEQAILVPHGIVLITGPTGSGKTTTLYSILNKINTPKVNIMTLEDPVEYEINGVNQVQVNPQAGLTFASGLRSFLRQDPNIIMVGEIRDTETAELAVQASLTGHLVFSTLHTNSAAGALPRLQDMEVEAFLLASSVTCIAGQRVVRQICEHCRAEYKPEPEIVADFKKVLGPLFDSFLKQKKVTEANLTLWRGEGCVECNDTGYSGRIGIFEVLPISEKVAKLIMEHASAGDIERQAITDGMILMKQDGYLKVLEGISTIEEVLRVAEI